MRNHEFVRTTPGFWVMLAFVILVLPLPWVWAVLISSMIHELCHIVAAKFMGVPVLGIRLGADGAYLDTDLLTPLQEMVCALAGPIGALLMILVARWMPRTAVCTVIQSVYHLLPIHPLDGRRALRGLVRFTGVANGNTMCFIAEIITLFLLTAAGLYLTVWQGIGILPLAVSSAVICRVSREKYLANRARKGYNISTNL